MSSTYLVRWFPFIGEWWGDNTCVSTWGSGKRVLYRTGESAKVRNPDKESGEDISETAQAFQREIFRL